jgi:energy-coupling factor transporter ATP-binding protein EcfA2
VRLRTYAYTQWPTTTREWVLSGLTLGRINLVVGKNASGKSRTLSTINGLGNIVSGRQKPSDLLTGTFKATFDHEGRTLRYFLDICERKVVSEQFSDGDKDLLTRGAGGVGKIFHEKQDDYLDFQTPEGDAAVVARRDSIQHSFLEPLGQWGDGVRHYAFGDKMGHGSIAVIVQNGPTPDPRDVNAVIGLFRKGVKDFPERFAAAVRDGMNEIGYKISEVGVMVPTDISFMMMPIGSQAEPVILFAKERDLPCPTQQLEMSQGMFRALSVIILLTYAVIIASRPSCLIVDDIGEGLDFERSCKLIDLMRRRARESDVQLIVSTNDKFVMNEVPLDEWSVLRRQGNHVTVRNHENSKKEFEYFRFVGMSNFTFFEMDFANGIPKMETALAHE